MENTSHNIATNKNVEIDFFLPYFRATKIVTRECHINDSAESRYNLIIGKYLPTALLLDLNFSEHIIALGDVTY